jgi:carboxypeptidase family protein
MTSSGCLNRRQMLVRAYRTLAFLLASAAGVPCGAFAQAIAGTVYDTSGTALPDVTVQAESSALIEKVRTVVTDGSGQYRIEDLRPGSYTITFIREGFRPHIREGIDVTSAFTDRVDAQLAPGALAETITVTGETPAVDVHSAAAATTLRGEVVKALPTVRSYNALVVLIPGVVTTANDVVTGTSTTQFPIHGGRANEGRLALDGLTVGSPSAGNSPASYVVDAGATEEVTFVGAGGLGETETGGLVVNLVPKTGGNSTHGTVFVSGTGEMLQSDNLTPALKNQGVIAASPLSKVYDLSGTIGGPIARDRLWYFVAAHRGGSTTDSTNVYYNLNAGDPTKWSYAPDSSRIAYSDRLFENASARVTWQMTQRSKVGAFWDEQTLCRTCTGATAAGIDPPRVSPEAVGVFGRPLRVAQATWSAVPSNRLLVEAGFGGTYFGFGNFERKPNPTRDLIRVLEQCASGCAGNGNIPGLVYRSQDFSNAYSGSYLWKGSVSYVTGSHSVRVGYQHTLMTQDITWTTNNQNLTYRFNNGVPNQLTQSISPWMNRSRTGWDAVFAQERWTRDRLTVQAAVRFDRARSWFPAQHEGPSRFLPVPIIIPETPGVDGYKDITPRLGASYDVFGDGRTALKVHLGRYLEGAGTGGIYTGTNPTLRMPQTTSSLGTAGVTRAWSDANGNFVPDCDLLNPNAQDYRASGGDLCGVVSNTSFGQNVLTNNFDPAILDGWGVRPSDWSLDVSIQRQVLPRASATLGYSRRWFHGFTVADNLALQPSDLMPFSVVAPVDPRLPGGGGYVVSGLYDVPPDKAGQVSNLIADSSKYGRWYQYVNGLDATLNLRAGGFTFIGGTSTGQTVADNCEVRAHLPELATTTAGASPLGAGLASSTVSPVSPYCHVAFGVQTQFRGLASYALPGIDAQLAVTLQSKPGAMLVANYAVPNAAVAASLGRDLSGNAPNVTVNLVAPGTRYGDRVNQLDVRVAKIVRHGRSRTMVALDIYNALNSSAGLTYNNAFVPGTSWPQPNTILTARFFRITAETEF